MTFTQRHWIRRHAVINQRPSRNILERVLWSIVKWSPYGGKAIPEDGSNPYLLRTYLLKKRLRIPLLKSKSDIRPYLHFFFRGDADREYHNHPFRVSLSLILTGGCIEYRWNPKTKKVDRRVLKPGSFNLIRRDDFHRVDLLNPEAGCWTLFVAMDRIGKSDGTDWGFLDISSGNYTPWGSYKGAEFEQS